MELIGSCLLQDPTPLPTPETPPVISTVVHATDEEKLASSVTGQKWTCMTVDLNTDKQDYPQPSDLSTFVNETKFSSPTEGTACSSQGLFAETGVWTSWGCCSECRPYEGTLKMPFWGTWQLWGAACETTTVQPWVFRKEKMLKGKRGGPSEKGFCFLCVINCSSLWVCSLSILTGEWPEWLQVTELMILPEPVGKRSHVKILLKFSVLH